MPKRNAMNDASQIIKSRITVTQSGCWEWPTKRRYGHVMIARRSYGVHHLSYLVHKGPIDDPAMCVCHTCDNTRCCNPDHLFLGTHAKNMADMVSKDRSGVRELNNRLGKLTDEQVRQIRAKHQRGIPTSWLATEYGIAVSYVRDIVNRRVKDGYEARHHAG